MSNNRTPLKIPLYRKKTKMREFNVPEPKLAATSTIIESATVVEVDQEVIKSRLMEVLRRESLNLLGESNSGKLDRDRSSALIGYLKLLNSIEDEQKNKLADLTDEELEKKSRE
jgi:hypothetical protein